MMYENPISKGHTVTLNRQAFLLRLWRENGRSPWRILLQSATTGERQTFTDLNSFFSHIEDMTSCPEETQHGLQG
ncbi:MAG: hypothetical protein AAF614_01635 [Chloroflexota bacterium]